jgi:hypothetical protein
MRTQADKGEAFRVLPERDGAYIIPNPRMPMHSSPTCVACRYDCSETVSCRASPGSSPTSWDGPIPSTPNTSR